jgi:polyphosphate kinase 2 (PPK2 family)
LRAEILRQNEKIHLGPPATIFLYHSQLTCRESAEADRLNKKSWAAEMLYKFSIMSKKKSPTLSQVLSALKKKVKKSASALSQKSDHDPNSHENDGYKDSLAKLQLSVLRIQQAAWHNQERVIIVFEGFDAAGKGGAIRRFTEVIDPRGVVVHPIGPPSDRERRTHWLFRFWTKLPAPGLIAIFDRSWYGRVLVERVDGLISRSAWQRAYREIRQFEQALTDEGVYLVKIFLAVSKKEQRARFEERLRDPYKRWKLTMEDLKARAHWDEYVKAVDRMVEETHSKHAPWHVIAADDKKQTRLDVLEAITRHLHKLEEWMEEHKGGLLSEKEIQSELKKID